MAERSTVSEPDRRRRRDGDGSDGDGEVEVAPAGPPLPTVEREVYEIESELARGGLGRVVRARDRRMDRIVAVKEVLPGRGTDERFVREALITGRLEHPGIVPVHEAGRWPSGEPFYSMKLVSGEPLSKICQRATGLQERLGLVPHVLAVAEAIAYAHSKRVIHRDIKPSNVIVGEFGETVVLDWGLAKELGTDEPPATGDGGGERRDPLATEQGVVMGTPAYMAPEQALGQPADERTDVYALGALLYHVLSGAAPHASSREAGHDTARGDSLLVEIATKPPPRLEYLVPGVPAELLAIARKAMSRRAADRYPSGQELAADLRRYLAGQLVLSHTYTPWALLRRWARRQRLPLAVAGVALLALAVIAGMALRNVVAARRAATEARALAEHRADELLLTQARSLLGSDTTAAVALLEQLPLGSEGWSEARAILEEARSRGFARTVVPMAHEPSAYDVAYSADGRWLASSGSDRTIRVVDRKTGAATRLEGHERAVSAVVFVPGGGGDLISAAEDSTVVRWTLGDKPERKLLYRHDDKVNTLAISGDGRVVATGGVDRKLHVHDLATGEDRVLAAPWSVATVALSRDGGQLVYENEDAFLVDLASGTTRELPTVENPRGLAWSNDGRWIALGDGRSIRLYDTRDLRLEASVVIAVSQNNIEALAFSADDSLLVAGTADGHIFLWSTASRTGQHLVLGNRIVTSVAIAPDATEVSAAALDGSLWTFPRPRSDSQLLYRFDPGAIYFAIDPAGRRIAFGARDRKLHVDDLIGGAARTLAEDVAIHKLAFVPGADALITLDSAKNVLRWDLATGAHEKLLESGDGINEYFRLSRDGGLLASVHSADSVWLYDLAAGKLRCRWPGNKLRHFAIDPGGRAVYWADGDRVEAGDAATCAKRTVFTGDRGIGQLEVSPDGSRLAWTRLDGMVAEEDLTTGTRKMEKAHRYDSEPLAYSPDGSRLASGSGDGTVVLWNAADLTVLHVLRGHEADVRAVRFSPDGRTLVSIAHDGTLRAWDVATGEGRVYRGHNRIVVEGYFVGGDGRRFVTSGTDGNIRLWTIDAAGGLPRAPDELRRWLEAATTARVVGGKIAAQP